MRAWTTTPNPTQAIHARGRSDLSGVARAEPAAAAHEAGPEFDHVVGGLCHMFVRDSNLPSPDGERSPRSWDGRLQALKPSYRYCTA